MGKVKVINARKFDNECGIKVGDVFEVVEEQKNAYFVFFENGWKYNRIGNEKYWVLLKQNVELVEYK